MATTIKLKSGSGAPLAGDLVAAEPALDLTNKRLYTENASGTVIEVGTNPTSLTTGTFTSTGIDDNATSTAITIDASENVGIGTASPSNQLHLNTTAASNVIQLTNSATGTGAGDGMQIVTSSLEMQLRNREAGPTTFYTSNIERMTIASGGNVGIGTSSPANKLDVNGILQSSSVGNYLQLQQSSTDGYINMTGSGGLNFRMGSGFDTRMTIDSSGNVGIGTTSPSHNLDVTSSTASTAVSMRVGPTASIGDNDGTLIINNGGSGDAMLRFDYEGNADRARIGVTSSGQHLGFYTAGANERMRIDSSGNVAIGDTTATEKLYVHGNALVRSGYGYKYGNGQVQHYSNDSYLRFRTGGTDRLTIDASGLVGIGTTSPAYVLDVYNSAVSQISASRSGGSRVVLGTDTSTGEYVGTISNTVFKILTNSTERMRIDSSGNLLVGRTNVTFGSGTNGAFTLASGRFLNEVSGDTCLALNRTDGAGSAAIVFFYRANTAAGQITATAGASPAFAYVSDVRLKDNVTDHESELANVMSLRPVRWDWNNLDGVSGEGFIAQELEQTAWADLVSEGDDGYKTVSGLGAVETRLIKALQEAVTRIETLEAEVAALKGA